MKKIREDGLAKRTAARYIELSSAERINVPQGFVGIAECDYMQTDSASVHYLATANLGPCVGVTCYSPTGTRRRTLLAHFDIAISGYDRARLETESGRALMEQEAGRIHERIMEFAGLIRPSEHTRYTIIQSLAADQLLNSILSQSMQEVYGERAEEQPLPLPRQGVESICINIFNGTIFRYPGVGAIPPQDEEDRKARASHISLEFHSLATTINVRPQTDPPPPTL
jgi:hypothetical protein